MKNLINNSIELQAVRAIFVANGFDLWFVGGAVRDALRGVEPKDIDLATSATPDEQIAIYSANDIRYFETGLQHGTLTVLLDQPYEITSLRTETDHDGRHAEVAFTRDLNEDLSRRDLTMNAIAMDFDGGIIDPFGGRDDLDNDRVRFVGRAEERMTEDYLRILRFFRFHARFAKGAALDEDAAVAIQQTRQGLAQISVERIWSEVSRIVAGPNAIATLRQMIDMALFEIIQMPYGRFDDLARAIDAGVKDSASLMGSFLSENQVYDMARTWKWSSAEKMRALHIARNTIEPITIEVMRNMLVDKIERDWVIDLARFHGADVAEISVWEAPVFPVTGNDLIRAGITAGPQMGAVLTQMRSRWKSANYLLTKADLMADI